MDSSSRSTSKDLVELLFAFMDGMAAHFHDAASDLDLTPPLAAAIRRLDQATPMHRLAEELGCDRSNVTDLVDRLELKGLVERRTDPEDRRVKQLVLTPAGQQTRRALNERLAAIPGHQSLSLTARKGLHTGLAQLVTHWANDPVRAEGTSSPTQV